MMPNGLGRHRTFLGDLTGLGCIMPMYSYVGRPGGSTTWMLFLPGRRHVIMFLSLLVSFQRDGSRGNGGIVAVVGIGRCVEACAITDISVRIPRIC